MDPHANSSSSDKAAKGSALIAMSGGVDSSAAAVALMGAGIDLVGCTMLLQEDDAACELAAEVAASLGFEHVVLDLRDRFAECVIDPFCSEYLEGRTPNPCVSCNRFLKFGALHDLRKSMGLDYLATGHYVRRARDPDTGLFQLRRANDRAKDQSYFLSHMSQDALASTLFPLEGLTKAEVRKIAADAGLGNAGTPESQDICFIRDGDYATFIEGRSSAPSAPGPIELEDGTVVGQHAGILRYTIGQRKGIGVAAAEPLYVVRIDASRNAVVVGPRPSLMTTEVHAKDVTLISSEDPATIMAMDVEAQTHYRHRPTKGLATFCVDGIVGLSLEEPIVKPASGQTLALYSGDLVLGGATICD